MQIKNFLLRHSHGVVYLADERSTASGVLDAKYQAIEARKDPLLPFVLVKVRGAQIPASNLRELLKYTQERDGMYVP